MKKIIKYGVKQREREIEESKKQEARKIERNK